MSPAASVQPRVAERMAWYDRAATRNHRYFHASKVLQLGAAAAVPILALAEADKLITAAVGALVAMLVGLEQVFRFHEKWLNYRSACEQLRMELFLFESGAGPYAGAALDAERERLLAERVASVSNREMEQWREAVARAGTTSTGAEPAP